MGAIRSLGALTLVTGEILPLVAAAASGITNYTISSMALVSGVMTVTLSVALPKNGFNGPNGYPQVNPVLDIFGGTSPGGTGKGQQVTLWGLGHYLDLNGKVVTVRTNDGKSSFTFNYSNPNSYSAITDTGKCATSPVQRYRVVRIECGQGNTTDLCYVGDLNLSATQYAAALSLTGQIAFEISGQNIDISRIFVLGTTADTAQVSVIQ